MAQRLARAARMAKSTRALIPVITGSSWSTGTRWCSSSSSWRGGGGGGGGGGGREEVQVIEVDLGGSDDEAPARRLEEAIHSMIAWRSAPDWLPFLPGASYWVPPPPLPSNTRSRPRVHSDSEAAAVARGAVAIVDIIGRLANGTTSKSRSSSSSGLSQDECLSFASERGWPSSDYFIQGRTAFPSEFGSDRDKTKDEE